MSNKITFCRERNEHSSVSSSSWGLINALIVLPGVNCLYLFVSELFLYGIWLIFVWEFQPHTNKINICWTLRMRLFSSDMACKKYFTYFYQRFLIHFFLKNLKSWNSKWWGGNCFLNFLFLCPCQPLSPENSVNLTKKCVPSQLVPVLRSLLNLNCIFQRSKQNVFQL